MCSDSCTRHFPLPCQKIVPSFINSKYMVTRPKLLLRIFWKAFWKHSSTSICRGFPWTGPGTGLCRHSPGGGDCGSAPTEHKVKETWGWGAAAFLSFGTRNIWCCLSLCCRGCAVHYGMFASISEFCPFNARSPLRPQLWQPKLPPELPKVPWGWEARVAPSWTSLP